MLFFVTAHLKYVQIKKIIYVILRLIFNISTQLGEIQGM